MKTLSKILSLIIIKENSIKNHFLAIFDTNTKSFYGSFKNETIFLWKKSPLNHPVFELLIKDDEIKSIKIFDNPLYSIIKLIVTIIFLALSLFIIFNGDYLRIKIGLFVILFVIFFLLQILLTTLKKEKNKLNIELLKDFLNTHKIINTINFKTIQNLKTNEFGLIMTLRRLVIYPFLIFIFTITVYSIYNDGYFKKGIIGIIIPILFIYSDIKILITDWKEKSKTNQ